MNAGCHAREQTETEYLESDPVADRYAVMSRVVVITGAGERLAGSKAVPYLRKKRFYKTLSLVASSDMGVSVPDTVLGTGPDDAELNAVFKGWATPLILRMDYCHRPNPKFLGGIPIPTQESRTRLSRFLQERGFTPLFHPFIDRFSNEYSVGVAIQRDAPMATVEVVGPGFDASDLRLGFATPQESFNFNLLTRRIENSHLLPREEYTRSRVERAERIVALHRYASYAASHGQLHSDLKRFYGHEAEIESAIGTIPEQYCSMPAEHTRSLFTQIARIDEGVLPLLPDSPAYVASLSMLPEVGWILWDIYGDWYER